MLASFHWWPTYCVAPQAAFRLVLSRQHKKGDSTGYSEAGGVTFPWRVLELSLCHHCTATSRWLGFASMGLCSWSLVSCCRKSHPQGRSRAGDWGYIQNSEHSVMKSTAAFPVHLGITHPEVCREKLFMLQWTALTWIQRVLTGSVFQNNVG